MQIQMAHLCLLPQEPRNVQMSSKETRPRRATSSPQELSIQTVIECASHAVSRQIVPSAVLLASSFVRPGVLCHSLDMFIFSQSRVCTPLWELCFRLCDKISTEAKVSFTLILQIFGEFASIIF